MSPHCDGLYILIASTQAGWYSLLGAAGGLMFSTAVKPIMPYCPPVDRSKTVNRPLCTSQSLWVNINFKMLYLPTTILQILNLITL